MDTEQMTLPYAAIENIAGAKFARTIYKRSGDIFTVPVEQIVIRQRFNARIKPEHLTEEQWEAKLEIQELAEGIFQNCGPMDPLKGDVTKDGTFIITEGERRTRAIRFLIASGRDTYPDGTEIGLVKCILNPAGTSELQRAKDLHNQQKMPLTPMQKGRLYLRYQECFGLTHEQIAEMLNISRQTVDNMVLLTKLTEEEILQVEDGILTPTQALANYRKRNKEESLRKKQDIIKVDKTTGQVIEEENENPGGAEGEGESGTGDNNGLQDDNSNPDTQTPPADSDNNTPVANPTKVETQQALDAEMKSRMTGTKTTDQLKDKLRNDAKEQEDSMQIDFKPDKELGEMELNELRKNNDKIYTIAKKLPANLKQYAGDIMQLVDWNNKKIEIVLEILKKAADKR